MRASGRLMIPLGTAPPRMVSPTSGVAWWFINSLTERLNPSASFFASAATGAGRTTKLIGDKQGDKGVPFPAAIAIVGGQGAELLVAENLSDDVLLLDAATGAVEHRFDLAEYAAVPSTYPIALATVAGRSACVCRAVECIGDCCVRPGKDLSAQADAAEAIEPGRAGDASVRLRAVS